jgi:hypothetical protein
MSPGCVGSDRQALHVAQVVGHPVDRSWPARRNSLISIMPLPSVPDPEALRRRRDRFGTAQREHVAGLGSARPDG